jgi:hypothetical protein
LVRCGWVLRAGVYEDEVLRYVLEHCTDMALAEVRRAAAGMGDLFALRGCAGEKKFLVFNAKRDV